MGEADPLAWLKKREELRRAAGLERRLRVRRDPAGPVLVDFASNDYLGLARDPRLVEAAHAAALEHGWGAGASPLVSGWTGAHEELAKSLARFEHAEAVALFPTGYAANLGVIAALVGRGDVVYGDRLNHSCLVQGVRMAGASLRVYPHGDAASLRRTLERDGGRFRRRLIATDGVFSMDGDLAPLVELCELADAFDAMLLVDEAHGTGVFGADGRGAAAELGVEDRVHIRVGTLSKSLGSVGGFVAGSRRLVDHLVNEAPTLLFSTAMPPPVAAAAHRALEISLAEPWRRGRVHDLGRRVREELRGQGWQVPESTGPIVPVIVGDPREALAVSSTLEAAGFLVPAIRPPTVPRGTARSRISLSATHTDEQVSGLIDAMGRRA